MTTVYASAGGHRYHAKFDCPALEDGKRLWLYDPQQWVPGMPVITLSSGHAVWATTPERASADGKQPCRRCYPAAVNLGPNDDHFGHEPVYVVTNGKLRTVECHRCTTTITHYDEAYRPSRWTRPVMWPCTTAVVLGLAPRSAV